MLKPKVTILGAAGGIGQPLSLMLKLNNKIGELALYDITNVNGVAADLSHINTPAVVKAYTGQKELKDALINSKLILIPAGVPRKPGMSRDDLFNVNSGIIMSLSRYIAKYANDALLNIITNPVNSTLPIVAEVMKQENCFNPNLLFGVTQLDLIRASTFASLESGKMAGELNVNVIGGHSGKTIVPLFSQLGQNFSNDTLKNLIHRVQFGGDEVVEAKQGLGSATLSMAHAAAVFANAIVDVIVDRSSTIQTAYVCNSAYKNIGLDYFASKVKITEKGISEIYPHGEVSSMEQSMIDEATKTLKADALKGISCVTGSPNKY